MIIINRNFEQLLMMGVFSWICSRDVALVERFSRGSPVGDSGGICAFLVVMDLDHSMGRFPHVNGTSISLHDLIREYQ